MPTTEAILEKRGADRRQNAENREQRKVNVREHEFIFRTTFFLEETNMFGNVYFANFFLMQGKCRESWLRYIVDPQLLPEMMQKYKMCTIHAEMDYKHEGLAFDDITIKLRSAISDKGLGLHFLFTFMKGETILGHGTQKIGFVDNETNKLTKVPAKIIEGMQKYNLLLKLSEL